MAIGRLALEQFRVQKVRVALTVAAIALSVSLVVAITSAYASAEMAAHNLLSRFMGAADLMINNGFEPDVEIPADTVQAIRDHPQVRGVVGRYTFDAPIIGEDGEPIPAPPARFVGTTSPKVHQANYTALERGEWFGPDDRDVAVIDQTLAIAMQIDVGETFSMPGADGQHPLRVVGITKKPVFLSLQSPSVYLPLETLWQALGKSGGYTAVLVDLEHTVDAEAFTAALLPRLEKVDPRIKARATQQTHEKIDQNMQYLHVMSYLGGAVTLVAAMFIVFSTLSMGVAERTRTLAMLRAIGMYRSQIAAMVVGEGLIIGLIGGLIGIPLGLLWTFGIAQQFPDYFPDLQIAVSWGGIVMGFAGSMGAALVASLLPAIAASRVSPLDAMNPLGRAPSPRLPWVCALIGVLLVIVDFVCVFWLPTEQLGRYYAHLWVGLPAFMLGMFLMAPAVVIAVERLFAPVIAWICRVNHTLVRQQLSGSVWRAAGTAAALMVGLTTMVVMHTRANTMLNGWDLPNRFPDVLLFTAKGLQAEDRDRIGEIDGLIPDQVVPVAYASPELGTSIFTIGKIWNQPEATIFFGIDPELAFGDGPTADMMEFTFIEGSPELARQMLAKPRHVLVAEEYQELKGLGIGDTILLKNVEGEPVEYTIAGVVRSPGVDVVMRMFNMRREFEKWTVASVMGRIDDAQRDFGVKKIHLFGANLQPDADRGLVESRIAKELGAWGVVSMDTRTIKAEMDTQFRQLIALLTSIAFAALLVASLGVTNTILASIRSRRWQLGVLRGIGLTRTAMLRLVLVEAALIGCVAAVLGVVSGLLLSIIAGGLSKLLIGFSPPIDVPWPTIALGVGITIAVALAASIIPAIRVARADTLSLLKAGRAAA